MRDAVQHESDSIIDAQIIEHSLGARPLEMVRQSLSESGKVVYRADLPGGQSIALRISSRPMAFAFTRDNLRILRSLGLPVQSVLAEGPTGDGGSFIILDWIRGRDLVHELGGMSRAQISRLAEQVVNHQRRLGHLPTASGCGWAPAGKSGNLKKWTNMFGHIISTADLNDGTYIGQLRTRLCAVRAPLEDYFNMVAPTPFLDDLTTKNVLIDNGRLSGLIDIDFVCYGDPLLAIGATMACVAGDVPEAGSFYGDELIRCWNPNQEQRLAVHFYAALWGIGLLQSTDRIADASRAQSLDRAVECWLSACESTKRFPPPIPRLTVDLFDRVTKSELPCIPRPDSTTESTASSACR